MKKRVELSLRDEQGNCPGFGLDETVIVKDGETIEGAVRDYTNYLVANEGFVAVADGRIERDGDKYTVEVYEENEETCLKRWAVITQAEHDQWVMVCTDKAAAVIAAEKEWAGLTAFEKKSRSVIAGLVNVDEDGNYYEDKSGNVDGDVYEIAWSSKEA